MSRTKRAIGPLAETDKTTLTHAGATLAFLLATFDLKVMEEEASVAEVARTILDYLRENPEAQDTLEGIVEWWLPDEQHQRRTATIKAALDRLVAAALITEHKGTDGQVSYRVMRQGVENPRQNQSSISQKWKRNH